ncbi:MAG TPA: hypothetical protein VM598_00910, partial [Bdellovibrionota bacterium]|nr:hypothetical protein [Bdellovibrionota bacterium]
GTCPAGMVVTPNHEGYAYAAEHLASWGFAVFSINANRGITCGGGNQGDFGLNLARGRLILSHLALISSWSSQGGAPQSLGLGPNGLRNRLQLGNVGLMGHSRGGEGARAAYTLFNDAGSPWPGKVPGLRIRAIYEIGAVDGQTDRVLDADGVAWNQLLPMCDGDVSDLQGRNPFERMIAKRGLPAEAQKSLLMVYGTNHNFFNTEWQVSDSSGCKDHQAVFPQTIGSPVQTAVALGSMSAFFRANLNPGGQFAFLDQLFNPLYEMFDGLSAMTRLDRDFAETTPSNQGHVVAVDDFDRAPGASSLGIASESSGVTATAAPIGWGLPTRALALSWTAQGSSTFYQTNWGTAQAAFDASPFSVLEFRVSQPVEGRPQTATDFTLALQLADGGFSREVHLADYADVIPPGNFTQLLQTVRVPLVDFGLGRAALAKLRGLRLTFDRQASGSVLLANVRLSRFAGLGAQVSVPNSGRSTRPGRVRRAQTPDSVARGEWVPASWNRVNHARPVELSHADGRVQRFIELELASRVPFQARDQLYVLESRGGDFRLSRYAEDGRLDRIRFLIPERDYARVGSGGFKVRLGPARKPVRTWQF